MSANVRTHRLSAGLTLEALAEKVGVTKSYLSKVERGKSSPSIAIGLRIAAALEVDAAEVFGAPDGDRSDAVTVERAAQRIGAAPRDLPVHDPIAAGVSGKQMHPFLVHPSAEPLPLVHHGGDELVYVIDGVVLLAVDDTVVDLHHGDSAYFDARRPHRITAASAEPATALVVTTIDQHAHGRHAHG